MKRKSVKFIKRYDRWNAGEIAGFDPKRADELIKAGVAEEKGKAAAKKGADGGGQGNTGSGQGADTAAGGQAQG